MSEQTDAWSNASKWLLGGAAAIVIGALVAIANFTAGAVWDKIVAQIVTEAQAESAKAVDKKIQTLVIADQETQNELTNLRTTQMTLIEENAKLKEAVEAQTVIGKQILQLLEAQQ